MNCFPWPHDASKQAEELFKSTAGGACSSTTASCAWCRRSAGLRLRLVPDREVGAKFKNFFVSRKNVKRVGWDASHVS